MSQHITYCRICPATCGLVVDVEDGVVTHVSGDMEHPLTHGFTCAKGRRIGDFHADPSRFRSAMRRGADGALEPVDTGVAIDEIAARLSDLIAEHGPDSVAFMNGTQAAMSSLTGPFANAWFNALGSAKRFSTMTVDQSAKWVADGRLGTWAAGRQRFSEADVWMLLGSNPPVSMQGGDFTGFPIHDGLRRVEEARERGLKLVVVDPRRTEIAAHADLHLQLLPGSDVVLVAGVLRWILEAGLEDAAFCADWALGLDELRAAVAPFEPALVARACGLDVDDVVAAARIFGEAERGMAHTGTGPDMGPWANVAEHLVRALNVVCGRYPRAGDPIAYGGVLGAGTPPPAEVLRPDRSWEQGYRSRIGFGHLKRELPVASLPDEILEPGDDRVRALVVVGSNPVSAVPDQDKVISGLSALELLVTLDPYPTETARLAHYVIAPTLSLERPDTTRAYEGLFEEPFAQHTPAILEPPAGVIDDWAFFARLAGAMGITLRVGGREYPPGEPIPSTDEVLATFAGRARVPLDEVKRHPHGKVFDSVAPTVVGPAVKGDARFELAPPDVVAEIGAALAAFAQPARTDRGHLLVVRRMKETLNSLGRRLPGLPRKPYNPCWAHPDDLAELGLAPGAVVSITSDHGAVTAVVEPDATMRRGVVSMTHAFGGMPGDDDDPLRYGANVTRLISLAEGVQTISAMPWMSAIPVTIAPAAV